MYRKKYFYHGVLHLLNGKIALNYEVKDDFNRCVVDGDF